MTLVFALACVTGLAGCSRTAPPASRTWSLDDEVAVRAVLQRQREAWNRGDIAGFMDGYARRESLVFTSGAKIRRGFEATDKKFRARYGDDPSTMGQLAFEILSVQGLGSDGAVVLGRWALTETVEAGSGVFSVVLERRDGRWEIVHDHTSSDVPPPEA